MNRIITSVWLLLATVGSVLAQSNPNLQLKQVPTPAQWNSYFSAKQDTLGYTPVNKAGDVLTGKLITFASTTVQAGLNIPVGAAPTVPVNGDLWETAAGIFARVNGSTIGPLAPAASSAFAGTSPITVSFPSSVVTYAFNFAIANTWLAQQTNQGATTTSPGWYAQVSGDTTPRVRVGLNATDIPSLAFGPGNAVRDAFIERLAAGSFRLGGPDAAAPVAQSIGVQNVVAGTSNTAGTNLTVSGSQGTGTGVGGSIVFQVAPAGSTGSTQNALATALTIDSTKRVTFAGPATMSAALTYGGVTLSNAVTGTGAMVLGTAPTITLANATGLPLTTGVTGQLPVANGGTNCSVASGACLDNIAGFASTGFLTRTGAGTYAFQSTTAGITNTNLATMSAFSFKGNNSGVSASPTDVTIPGLTAKASPVAGDLVMIGDSAASNAWKQTTVGALASAGSVSSIAGNTGPFTLSRGITNSTNDIRLAAPYFNAYKSTDQTPVTSGSPTKLQANTKTFDSNTWYDAATNFRYTPLLAGVYRFHTALQCTGTTVLGCFAYIYKNGTIFAQSPNIGTSSAVAMGTIDILVSMNGSTDFVEAFGINNCTGTCAFAGGNSPYASWFEASFVSP